MTFILILGLFNIGFFVGVIAMSTLFPMRKSKDTTDKVLPLGMYITNNGNPYEKTHIEIVNSSRGFSEYYFVTNGSRSYSSYSDSNRCLLSLYKKAE